jgi:glycosyltransferase involved in cell wall biosynthesis
VTTPRVSVLIPTYNRAALLREALDSVFAQTFQDFEIIVVDDGSTDDTREVVGSYGPDVQYLFIDHGGPARARNAGMQAARGEYLCYLDSDDLYYPHKLALQVDHLDRHPDSVMVYTDFSAFDARGFYDEFHLRTYHKSAYRSARCAYEKLFAEQRPLTANRVIAGWGNDAWLRRREYRGNIFAAYLFDTVVFTNSMMFRRSLLPQVGLQDPYFGHFHDLEFALRICRAGQVGFIDNPTYKLRYHADQVSTLAGREGDFNAVKLQAGLLRVARVHALRDASFYAANRARVDLLISRLCRAVAVRMISYGGPSAHRRRFLPRRARRYLKLARQLGHSARALYFASYLPTTLKRVYFRIAALLQRHLPGRDSAFA